MFAVHINCIHTNCLFVCLFFYLLVSSRGLYHWPLCLLSCVFSYTPLHGNATLRVFPVFSVTLCDMVMPHWRTQFITDTWHLKIIQGQVVHSQGKWWPYFVPATHLAQLISGNLICIDRWNFEFLEHFMILSLFADRAAFSYSLKKITFPLHLGSFIKLLKK